MLFFQALCGILQVKPSSYNFLLPASLTERPVASAARKSAMKFRARSRALTMKEDAWVVFAHPGGKKRDALRLVIKEGGQFSPVGPWLQLPQGITFHIGGNTLMGESPPSEILLAACNGTPAQQDCSYGGLLFRGSERIALPRQGGNQLSLQLGGQPGPAHRAKFLRLLQA